MSLKTRRKVLLSDESKRLNTNRIHSQIWSKGNTLKMKSKGFSFLLL